MFYPWYYIFVKAQIACQRITVNLPGSGLTVEKIELNRRQTVDISIGRCNSIFLQLMTAREIRPLFLKFCYVQNDFLSFWSEPAHKRDCIPRISIR